MYRSATRLLIYLLFLALLGGVSLFGRFPFYEPDRTENGPEDPDEIQLTQQRLPASVEFSIPVAGGRRATFGGNPYLVGPIVTPTTTLPEAETNIAINPAKPANLIALITDYSLRPGNIQNNGVSKWAQSNDGGNTWTEGFVPTMNNAYGATSDRHFWLVDRDPGVVIGKQGFVYFSGLYLKFAPGGASTQQGAGADLISRSTTPGGLYVCATMLPALTMTSASCRPVFTATVNNPTTSEDRDWIAVDNSTASSSGNVYATWTHYTGCTGQTCQTKFIAFSRSTDHGVTWSPLIQVSAPQNTIVDWPMVTVGSDGTVYVAYQNYIMVNASRQHFLAISTDGGQTFGTPIQMTPTFENVSFTCPYRKNSAPNIVVSSVAGKEFVYDVFARQNGTGSDISFVRSRQPKGAGGFTSVVALNDSTAGQREYPAAALDSTGTLHVVWLDTRNSPTDVTQYDVYATFSKTLGASFAPNARVTPALINGNTDFLGDFFGIVAEPRGIAHAVWTNGGDINGQMQTTTLTPQ